MSLPKCLSLCLFYIVIFHSGFVVRDLWFFFLHSFFRDSDLHMRPAGGRRMVEIHRWMFQFRRYGLPTRHIRGMEKFTVGDSGCPVRPVKLRLNMVGWQQKWSTTNFCHKFIDLWKWGGRRKSMSAVDRCRIGCAAWKLQISSQDGPIIWNHVPVTLSPSRSDFLRKKYHMSSRYRFRPEHLLERNKTDFFVKRVTSAPF